jgi:hypothetical protein
VYEYDPGLENAFRIAGEGRFDPRTLAAIGRHRTTVYVRAPSGSVEAAWRAARAACAVLDAGGLAVKIETTGKAHTPDWWREAASSNHLFALYCLMVVLVGGPTHAYSCGMHNFGLPDCTAPLSAGREKTVDLINGFLFYVLSEAPDLASRHTFQAAEDQPVYRLAHGPSEHPIDHPFHNPYGVWQLAEADNR